MSVGFHVVQPASRNVSVPEIGVDSGRGRLSGQRLFPMLGETGYQRSGSM